MPVDNSIALQTKVPDGMASLGSMLNVARGAQEYGQAQQMNPLAQQAAQLEIQKQQGMLAPTISSAETEAAQKKLGLGTDQFKLIGNTVTGIEYSDAFKNGNIPEIKRELKAYENLLNANGIDTSKTLDGLHKSLDSGDIQAFRSDISNIRTGLASSAEKFGAALPSFDTIGGQPITTMRGGPMGGSIAPAPIGTGSMQQGNMPSNTGMGAQPVQPPQSAPAAPIGAPVIQEAQAISQPVPPRYPQRPGNIITDPAEISYRDQGISYVKSLSAQQLDLTTQQRNYQEATKSVGNLLGPEWQTYGLGGKIKKEFSEKVAGSPEYAKVSKDLANLELSNFTKSGGSINSVEGLKLQQRASGTEVYPPEVLSGIVRRVGAEQKNVELQAKAAKNYADKFGESNLPKSFITMWSNNADSKVFEMMNLVKEIKDPKKQLEAMKDLFGDNPTEIAIARQKAKNIQKLVNEGTL